MRFCGGGGLHLDGVAWELTVYMFLIKLHYKLQRDIIELVFFRTKTYRSQLQLAPISFINRLRSLCVH